MATLARSPRQCSAAARHNTIRALADELRRLLDRCGAHQAHALVADFAARHRLTHRDVDALLAALTRNDVEDTSPAVVKVSPPARPFLDKALVTVSPRTEAIGTPESSGEATEDKTEMPDDLGWMFGEEPEAPAMRPAADVVGRALDDLVGDWSRTGGQLTHAEVSLLATKRKLSSHQYDELLNLLEQAGVDLPDLTSSPSLKAAMKGYEFLGDSIGHYLKEIGRYPLISAAREVELWSLIAQGKAAQQELDAMGEGESVPGGRRSLRNRVEAGRQAHAELVCANLRLVVSIAKGRHYDASGVDFADRIQEGNLGLIHAASKFDGSKGFKFSTYATWWVKQAIDRGIGNQGRLIRIPVHVHEQVQKVRRAVSRLTARLDREPTLTEISQMTDMDPGKVQSMLDLMQPVRSLDALLGHEGDLRLSDLLVSEEERDGRTDPAEIVIHATFRSDVARALRAHLPERAARVVERRFGLGTGDEETLDDIGVDYGITRERIRQIQGNSMKKLQMSDQVAALRSYLVDDSKTGWSGDSTERKAS